ncbi:AMP-binding protein [Pacificimonas flava]|uniref:Long-chain-fatty-acid--CoA ligase n=1 Tax=Pacificimonas flava TaxID=1234595 RepID=M2U982_9SPHN|nr:AMP-binding protein [Pacificimonas flava]EMD84553.1 Long-chain-fatty-acid--CoA ligase [Pacificimonas flava]MBB5279576.1 fatty-acyl-CoA synthase [Pacificimonas flava]
MQQLSFGEVASSLSRTIDRAAPAIFHGGRTIGWGAFDDRTDALAAAFLAAGATPGDKVAHLMRNSPAYLETTWAGFKARLVHVNVNYRYTGEELFYILDNSDAAVIVYDAAFADLIAELQPRLTNVRLFVQVGGDPADFACSFAELTAARRAAPAVSHRSDDMLFIYTGGTTGHPKGVMWNQGDLWALLGGGAAMPGDPPCRNLAGLLRQIAAGQRRPSTLRRSLILPPLMHGSGFLVAIYTLATGGSVVLCEGQGYDPDEALSLIEMHRPNWAVIVGDAFARPLLRSLETRAGDISALQIMISSGTMWSPETKAGLLHHNPNMMLLDALGSSESLGMGMSITASDNVGTPTRFQHDPDTILVDEDLKPIEPGDPRTGRIARGGLIPRGYYRDADKTASTFLTIDGKRYSLAGDHARIDADGTIILMGRGNQCINTGGEKVYPEEVEEALKSHPAVDDALVFGTPDDRWGSAVSAVVHTVSSVAPEELISHVRSGLAAYKAPKGIKIVERVPRAPNGKADYAAAKILFAA